MNGILNDVLTNKKDTIGAAFYQIKDKDNPKNNIVVAVGAT